jgi:hypothetical protein
LIFTVTMPVTDTMTVTFIVTVFYLFKSQITLVR